MVSVHQALCGVIHVVTLILEGYLSAVKLQRPFIALNLVRIFSLQPFFFSFFVVTFVES